MSGGHFEHNQYIIPDIADDISRAIANNSTKNDYGYSNDYSNETLEKFKEAILQLRLVANMVHQIDWLLSGDTGEETFHERWEKEVFNVT